MPKLRNDSKGDSNLIDLEAGVLLLSYMRSQTSKLETIDYMGVNITAFGRIFLTLF